MIFLLSDTKDLNPALKRRLGFEVADRGKNIAYISSSPQNEDRAFFRIAQAEYNSVVPDALLEYFDLGGNFSDEDLQHVLNFGTIHLSGGNTFAFVDALRKRSFRKFLAEHLFRNGLIVGVSAGAIALTPSVATAAMCGDVNSVGMEDLSGAGLVDFGFLPHLGTHYLHTSANEARLKALAVRARRKVYVGADADGLLVDGSEVHPFGNLLIIEP